VHGRRGIELLPQRVEAAMGWLACHRVPGVAVEVYMKTDTKAGTPAPETQFLLPRDPSALRQRVAKTLGRVRELKRFKHAGKMCIAVEATALIPLLESVLEMLDEQGAVWNDETRT
jgi:hypothetical protein